jgi:hypothetical protein
MGKPVSGLEAGLQNSPLATIASSGRRKGSTPEDETMS